MVCPKERSVVRKFAYVLKTIAALSSLLIVSCGVNSTTPAPSRQSAYVTHSQAQRAFDIIEDIDYIPFEYTEDGCYARALYMSMELAVQHIPSSSEFIKATRGLLRFGHTVWTYHVAPALIVTENPETAPQTDEILHDTVSAASIDQVPANVTITDPAMSDDPVSLREWVGMMVSGETEAYTVIAPANYYDPWTPPLEEMEINVVRDFRELAKFRLSDIGYACGTMHAYLGDQVERKRKLKERTAELIDRLQQVGKLSEDISFEAFICQ
jgi:hypothetical protein